MDKPTFLADPMGYVEHVQGALAVWSFEAQMVDPLVDTGIQQRAAHYSVKSIWGPKLVFEGVRVVASLSVLIVCIIRIKRLCLGLSMVAVVIPGTIY
jgi:hypothetical protein